MKNNVVKINSNSLFFSFSPLKVSYFIFPILFEVFPMSLSLDMPTKEKNCRKFFCHYFLFLPFSQEFQLQLYSTVFILLLVSDLHCGWENYSRFFLFLLLNSGDLVLSATKINGVVETGTIQSFLLFFCFFAKKDISQNVF